MTHKEFRAWLQRIESSHPVLDWRVGGLRIWPMARLTLYGANFHARSKRYSLGQSGLGYARLGAEALSAWARARLADAENSVRPDGHADAVFLTNSVGRQPVVSGRRYNPRLAPYVELLARRGLRSVVWEMSPYADYNIPRYTPSAFIQPRLLWWRLRSQSQPAVRFTESLPGWEGFLADVGDAGFTFPYEAKKRLHRDVFYVRRLADQFAAWLRRIQPRVSFVADASAADQAFCLACRELGIPSIEIQHGVQGAMHPIYASWSAVPPEGFATRPRAWWCWDAESAAVIMEWAESAPQAHTAIVGGDPWREMWLSVGNEEARRTLADVRAHVAAAGGEHHILVTLSSIHEVLPESVLEVVRRSPSDWRWWFRMHPVNQAARRPETVNTLASVGQEETRMQWATEVPLHALLQFMDCHVTVGFSTVVQDAAAVGVPSIGCSLAGADFYAAEVGRGIMRIALTADELTEGLEAFLVQRKQLPSGTRPDPDAAMGQVLTLRAAGNGRERAAIVQKEGA